MADYIERQTAVSRFEKLKEQADTMRDKLYLDGVLAVIDTLPAANVREDVQGEWKFAVRMADGGVGKCSICGKEIAFNSFRRHTSYHFCPNCGAQMDGGKEQ